jgi:hypothetical protein
MRAVRADAWPILAISSFVLAPVAAASVLPVWRRSWKCSPLIPTALRARCQAACNVTLRNGRPEAPGKTSSSGSRFVLSARWRSRFGDNYRWDRNDSPAGVSLRRSEYEGAVAELLILLDDGDRPMEQIEIPLT